MRAVRHWYRCRLRGTWTAWQLYVQKKREKWKKLMCADVHFQQVVLSKTLRGWKVYHWNRQQILHMVDEKEKKLRRELLRFSFCTWKENAHLQADESRKATRADRHYHRVLLSKVLEYWRDAVSLQLYQRQQEEELLIEARRHIGFLQLQHAFSRWKQLSQSSVTQRGQMETAAQHYGQKIMMKCLSSWKQHHSYCLRAVLLQRQGEWFQALRLCRRYFTDWKVKLSVKHQEDKQTAIALWHWSLSLQGKVFDAWLMFTLERRRKRMRVAKAAESYRSHLLRTGVAAILRYTSDMMQFRSQVAAEHQMKTAYSLHQVVYRCAMIWKQKALCKRERLKHKTTTGPCKKTVVFKLPVAEVYKEKSVSMKAGILRSEPRKRVSKATPNTIRNDGLPTMLPAGDMDLTTLSFAHPVRLQPRRPGFLLESLQKKDLLDSVKSRGNALRSDSTTAATSVSSALESSAQTRPLDIRDHSSLSDRSENNATEGASCQSLHIAKETENLQTVQPLASFAVDHFAPSRAVAYAQEEQPVHKELLLPPSAFLSLGKEKVSANLDRNRHSDFSDTRQIAKDKGALSWPSHADPQLLSPDDFRVRSGCRSLVFQDTDSEDDFDGEAWQCQLEAELQGIRQEMQRFHDNKQNLRSWRKQASVLRNWLQINAADKEEEELEMRQELKKLERDIENLAKKLTKDVPYIQSQLARVQEIRKILIE